MRLAILFLLIASAASAQQGWTPRNFYSYMPLWVAHRLGQKMVDTDLFMICVSPSTMSPAPMYFAELSWDSTEGSRQAVSFMAYPRSFPQTCQSFRVPPVTADGEGLKNIRFSVTPLIQAGEAFIQGP